VLSYVGRTGNPRAQPIPVRVGGFGGVAGLAAYLKEAHGIEPAAGGVMMAAGPAAAGGGAAAPAEEAKSTFDVVLKTAGDKKIQVIKVVRAATGLGLKEAKALVDEAPKPVKEGIEREEADKLVADIEEAGGTVELK